MIFNRSKMLFTKLISVNLVKCVSLNQTWIAPNVLKANVLPYVCFIPRKINTCKEVIIPAESLEVDGCKKCYNKQENSQSLETIIRSYETAEELLRWVQKQNIDSLSFSNIILILNHLVEIRIKNKQKFPRKQTYSRKRLQSNLAFLKMTSVLENEFQKMDANDLINLYIFCKNFKLKNKFFNLEDLAIQIDKKKNELNFCRKVQLLNLYSSDDNIPNDKKRELEFLILTEAKVKLKSFLIEDILDVLSHSFMFPMPNEMKIEVLKTTLGLGRENWCRYDIAYPFLNFFSYVHKDFPEFEDIQKQLLDMLQECTNDYNFIANVSKFFPVFINLVTYKKLEYRSHLFNCILDGVIKYNVPFEEKMIICHALLNEKLTHSNFLENLVETVIKDPSLLSEESIFTLTKAVMVSGRYFRKKEWECFFNCRRDLINLDIEKKLFSYAAYCAGSGLFNNEVFQRLSTKLTKEVILNKSGESCLIILLMNHAIETWNPSYVGSFLTEECRSLFLKRAQENLENFYFVYSEKIKDLIESAVGVKDCVLTCCWTKHGELIDQVMALNERGEPISLAHIKKPGKILYIEDINLPPNSKLVLIVNFYKTVGMAFEPFLFGIIFLKLHLLKELGHLVIAAAFDCKSDVNLSDLEKGQFVWKQIQEKYISFKKHSTNSIGSNEAIIIPHEYNSIFSHNHKIDVVISDEKNWSENVLPVIDGHIWFSDGSKKTSGIGSGIYCPERELKISKYSYDGTSLDAEVDAITACAWEALIYVENFNSGKTVVNILTDSYNAINRISNGRHIASEKTLECLEILKKLSERVHVRIIWVPGHSGIKGNLKADFLAKMGASGIQVFSEKIIDGER